MILSISAAHRLNKLKLANCNIDVSIDITIILCYIVCNTSNYIKIERMIIMEITIFGKGNMGKAIGGNFEKAGQKVTYAGHDFKEPLL